MGDHIMEIGGALLMSALAWLALKVKSYINEKVKNEAVKGVLSSLSDAAFTAVQDTYQTYVKEKKAQNDWSKDAKEMAAVTAARVAELRMGPEKMKALKAHAGGSEEAAALLRSAISAAIPQAKAAASSQLRSASKG